jgi:hypothetical protein
MAGLISAYAFHRPPDVVQAHTFEVQADRVSGDAASIGMYKGKVAFGTVAKTHLLATIGENDAGAGVILLGDQHDNDIISLKAMKMGGGSFTIFGPDGKELANASPNVDDIGSVFISNAGGKLIGEFNADSHHDGVVAAHNSKGEETARVH